MIEELRIYRVRAGGLGQYLHLAQTVQMPIRGDRHGVLLGFWHAEVGAAHSVFNLWRHQGLDHREEVRVKLGAIEAWRNEYLARVWPLMEEQLIRLMQPLRPFSAPAGSHVYEVRFFRCRVGEARDLAARLLEEAPLALREHTVGAALTIAGHLNEVVHFAAYEDLAQRTRTALTHPDWQSFLDRHGGMIAGMQSSLLLPAPHSPAQ